MQKLSNENLSKVKGKCGIYKIIIGRHFYIGSSNNIANRLHTHKNTLHNNCHHNHTMQNCFNKYGPDALMFEVVEECTEDNLLEREGYYMQTLKPDMNHIMDPTRPSQDRESIELARATRMRNNKLLNRKPGNAKKVYQYDADGNFIKEWDTATDAANFYKGEVSAICGCCNKRAITAYGFQWSYEKENKDRPIKNWRGNIIIQYDQDMNPVAKWMSFGSIARELHIERSSIKKASDTHSMYKNSYWSINPEIVEDFKNVPLEKNPALKCKKFENNNPNTSRIIYQYDMEGNYMREYPSASEAGRYLNVDHSFIAMCANENQPQCKSAHGYRWSYIKYDKLPEYVNNSSKAVNRSVITFDAITGEEKEFESIASAVRYYEPNATNFDSSCSALSCCANKSGLYLGRYLAKSCTEEPYVLAARNYSVYDVVNNKVYMNAKVASSDTGASVDTIKNACKEENNNEWLYVNQCARVKLRESGKLFK